MSNQANYVAAALAAAGALGGAYCAYRVYQEHQKRKIPEQWTQVGTLNDLYLYPIKSCAPAVLEKAECTVLGLRDGWLRDRTLMIVDSKNNFVTARAHPELLLVHPTMRNSVLTLTHPNAEPVHVNLAEVAALQKLQTATVWGVEVPVYDCGWAVGEWLSRLMDKSTSNYRLMYYATDRSRDIRAKSKAFPKLTKHDTGALPDETSFNLINEASVEDLNTRLKSGKATHRHFRPNFVLQGGKPYDEDSWNFVKIGDNVFEVIKPCTRCILTTIDPETGVRDANAEPLETLKTYRQIEDPEMRRSAGNSPRMGIQMALRSEPGGIVRLNDPIYVA